MRGLAFLSFTLSIRTTCPLLSRGANLELLRIGWSDRYRRDMVTRPARRGGSQGSVDRRRNGRSSADTALEREIYGYCFGHVVSSRARR